MTTSIACVRPFKITHITSAKKELFTECAYYPVLVVSYDGYDQHFLVRSDSGKSVWVLAENCQIVDEWSK